MTALPTPFDNVTDPIYNRPGLPLFPASLYDPTLFGYVLSGVLGVGCFSHYGHLFDYLYEHRLFRGIYSATSYMIMSYFGDGRMKSLLPPILFPGKGHFHTGADKRSLDKLIDYRVRYLLGNALEYRPLYSASCL